MKITDAEFAALPAIKQALESAPSPTTSGRPRPDAQGDRRGARRGVKRRSCGTNWRRGQRQTVVDDFVDLAANNKKVNFFRTPESRRQVKADDVKGAEGTADRLHQREY